MKISDILGMSLSNLWRRKMRTFLTVLGVIIGTASIVVMLSLGIGLQQATMAEVQSAGGLTEIMVYSEEYGSDELLLDDKTIDTFMKLDNVEGVEPLLIYSMPVQAGGTYEGYCQVIGVTEEYLNKIELGEGNMPEQGGTLSMIAGNQVIMEFSNIITGEWADYESMTPLDVDLLNDPLVGGIEIEEDFTSDSEVLDDSTSDYHDSTFSDAGDSFDFSSDSTDFSDDSSDSSDDTDDLDDEDNSSDGDESNGFADDFSEGYFGEDYGDDMTYSWFTSSMKRVQVQVTGITAGGTESYTEYSDNCYTYLDSLKDFLKKNYNENSVIPGQPTDREGKPYRDLKYSMLIVNVDDASNVEDVLETIQRMGYSADANKEWLEQTEKQFMIIEAVLGGIGAVAMLVAAISIANTMTMSIYERTKEIGIMKVLGCGLGNIRSMFLTEAAFIGLLGGAAGIMLSYLLSVLVNKLIAPTIMGDYGFGNAQISVIPMWLVLAAIVFSTIIGMVAGFFPAQRATTLSPLAAIRNE